MPELPEVETIRIGLQKRLPGEVVKRVSVLRSDSIGSPDATNFAKMLAGHRFEKVRRRGKYLLIELDGTTGLAVHLRMSGRLIFVEKKKSTDKEDRFLRVKILFESGNALHYEDMRVFGRLWYVPSGSSFEDVVPGLCELGIEPLEGLDGKLLQELLRGKKQPIKSALLDQRLIAGIGNIYADEALFLAGIHPLCKAGGITLNRLHRLSDAIVEVLENGIKHGGSTLRDYRNSEGINGNYQDGAWVYGRKGESCRKCRGKIDRVKIAGRSAHYCLKCQPSK